MQTRQGLGDALAVAAFVLYVVGKFLLSYTTLRTSYPIIVEMNLDKAIEVLSMLLAIAAIVTRKRALTTAQISLFVITLALLLVSSVLTGDYLLAQTCVLVFALGGIRLDRLCGIYSLLLLAMIAGVVALSVLGLTYNKDVIPNDRLVFSYGFGHPNSFGAFLISCCAAFAYACWTRRSWWVSVMLSAVSAVFSYVYLSSRAATLILAALAIAIIVGQAMRRRGSDAVPRRIFFVTLTVLPLLMLVAMIAATAFYSAENPAFVLLDRLTNGRAYFAHQYYTNWDGFTLFGSEYNYKSNYHTGLPFTSVDSGYCKLALSTGVFPLIAMGATYVTAVWKLSRENSRFIILVILLLCAAHLMVEPYQLTLVTGVMAIFVSQAFADKRTASD